MYKDQTLHKKPTTTVFIWELRSGQQAFNGLISLFFIWCFSSSTLAQKSHYLLSLHASIIGSDWSGSDEDEIEQVVVHLEERQVTLPSALAPGEIQCLGITGSLSKKPGYDRGQINDATGGVAACPRREVVTVPDKGADSRSQRTTSRAWKDVNQAGCRCSENTSGCMIMHGKRSCG